MGVDGQFLNRGFAFQAPAWRRCQLHEVMLRKVFRQQSDQKFLHILQDIRHGPGSFKQEHGVPRTAFYGMLLRPCFFAHRHIPEGEALLAFRRVSAWQHLHK